MLDKLMLIHMYIYTPHHVLRLALKNCTIFSIRIHAGKINVQFNLQHCSTSVCRLAIVASTQV